MRTSTKTLAVAVLAAGGTLAMATLQANPTRDTASERPHSGGMMSGGMMSDGTRMMDRDSGDATDGESGGMMSMMRQMSRMMKNCNEMMESHGHTSGEPAPSDEPSG